MNIRVLYEDNHLLVVEKPANVPVQADASGDEDLLTACKGYIKEIGRASCRERVCLDV